MAVLLGQWGKHTARHLQTAPSAVRLRLCRAACVYLRSRKTGEMRSRPTPACCSSAKYRVAVRLGQVVYRCPLPSPRELFLTSVATCSGLSIVHYWRSPASTHRVTGSCRVLLPSCPLSRGTDFGIVADPCANRKKVLLLGEGPSIVSMASVRYVFPAVKCRTFLRPSASTRGRLCLCHRTPSPRRVVECGDTAPVCRLTPDTDRLRP